MGKKKKSSTEQMLDAVAKAREESEEGNPRNFPSAFLIGLRGALDAGLSGEEITALLVLFSGIYEASARMAGEALIERASAIAEMMAGDINEKSRDRLRVKKNKESRERKKREKWFKRGTR